MEDISLLTILVSIAASVIGSLLVAYCLKIRERSIKKKIKETHEYENYLERLSKGNIKLLRSTLFVILISLVIFSFTFLIFIVILVFNLPSFLKSMVVGANIGLLIAAIFGCIYQAKAIVQSANLKETKQHLQEKRNKLEDKIT
jgi:uncharacterized membrane protein YqjE